MISEFRSLLALILIASASSAVSKIIGTDDRLAPAATQFTEDEKVKYSGIGRIECRKKNGKWSVGTAFAAGNFSTMITVAHNFYDDDLTLFPVANCRVSFYDYDGTLRERISILDFHTRWSDKNLWRDPSNDLAVIKLSTRPTTVQGGSTVVFGEKPDIPQRVTLVATHGDLRPAIENQRLRKVFGTLRKPTEDGILYYKYLGNLEIRDVDRIAATDYDAEHGASGGPVFNSSGKIIGLHVGYIGETGLEFDSSRSFNVVCLFDDRLKDDLLKAINR